MKLTLASALPFALGATAFIAGSEVHDSTEAKDQVPSFLSSAYSQLKDVHGELTPEAISIWKEVADLFPGDTTDAVQRLTSKGFKPKAASKRPDSDYDYIITGDELESMYVTNSGNGEKRKKLSGNFKNKRLRVKKPNSLGIDEDVRQLSGYLDVDDDKHFFFWFFESRNDPENDPVTLWLNGGPGCSSMTGLFMELGPSSINSHIKPEYNKFSWNSNSSVIFLDQPVNVGYSYSDTATKSTAAAAEDVYAFLTLFFEKFPQYGKQDFHIAGESYAGHYIPTFAAKILEHEYRNINLKSILIGNGLTDGLTQYKYYAPMACGKGGYEAVLSPSECANMESAYPRCGSLIQGCYDSQSVWRCVPASIYCNNAMMGPYQRTGLNVYDIRGRCEDSSNLCYPEMGYIKHFMNKKEVMSALGAEVSSFDSCNFDVNRDFLFNGDWMLPFHKFMPNILKKIPVLIYAGDADFICNWLGNQAWTNALEWEGKAGFNGEQLTPYMLGDKEVGQIKSSGNFTFLRLYQAGHMVPYNQPESSLQMLNEWLEGKYWETSAPKSEEEL
ncbi:Alpha/Beta hydrolase protein [Tirmania nivea]|nr:Alpha/Beta hydrolase protein [Tirmania nivea]